jgi:hypothetical protein
MLYYATKPDPLFTKIVDVALSLGRERRIWARTFGNAESQLTH